MLLGLSMGSLVMYPVTVIPWLKKPAKGEELRGRGLIDIESGEVFCVDIGDGLEEQDRLEGELITRPEIKGVVVVVVIVAEAEVEV